MKEKKFNFTPVHLMGRPNEDGFTVTVVTAPQRQITFPAFHPETNVFIGKQLEFFVDTQKNALGWKVFEKGDLGSLINTHPVTTYENRRKDGTLTGRLVRVSANNAIKLLKTNQKSFKKIPVHKYKETGLHGDGKTIYYVEINHA